MGITITSILAYLLIISYFAIERALRKGQQALCLQTGQYNLSLGETIAARVSSKINFCC